MPESRSLNGEAHGAVHVNDERTPLLAAIGSAPIGESAEAEVANEAAQHHVRQEDTQDAEEKPFPRTQIFLLCYTRLVEPVAFFSIIPYINTMIENTGDIPKANVGFYVGLIESLFSLTQMCVMIYWGRAADRFGRKPVLAISLYGVTICTALFGFSTSIWQMIVFRCMAGIFSGTVVTVRAMLSENSTKKTQADVFSWFAFVGNLGITIGPLLGGALENPATKFSSTFGRIQFFHDYPYALPGFASAFIGLSAAIIVTLFVKETLHVHENHKNSSNAAPLTTWELFKYPGVARVTLIYNYVMLLAFAFTATYSVFMYEPVKLGGLGLSPSWIAFFMAFGGLAQAFWLLALFPWLHRRVGTVGVLRFCAVLWPIFFAFDPIMNLLLRHGQTTLFWIWFPLNNLFGPAVAMAFTCVQLAINDISPSPESFGTLNAVVLALQSGLRAVVPAASTALYAIGVKYQIIGGQLFWVVLVFVAMGLALVLRLLPEKCEGRPEVKGRDEEDQEA